MGVPLSRRWFLGGSALLAGAAALPAFAAGDEASAAPLAEFGYDQVRVLGRVQGEQRANVTATLAGLDEDSLLKPFRAMSGVAAPGVSLGGWYEWNPDYDHHHSPTGLAPGSTLGQWTSAMARLHVGGRFGGGEGEPALAAKAARLNAAVAALVGKPYFSQTRFAGYTMDKLHCGLMDAHRLLADPAALAQAGAVRAAAQTVLPGHAVDREVQWKLGADVSWMWDETYTIPENQYLLSAMGEGAAAQAMAEAYLLDATFFEPLARGENALADHHAYSYVNALCSAMQAWLTGGSAMHLRAARNGFRLLGAQSFATGGWGPDELLRKPGYDEVAKSLTASHNGFETPCGSYAHLKLTRYLVRATRDAAYADSMERVFWNTVLGALPLQPNGKSFYNSDYNVAGKRVYSDHIWPCCSGTLPQVVADYGLNSYLRSPGAVWVLLYQPSELRWVEGGTAMTLAQEGGETGYPYAETVRLRLTATHPQRATLYLRIPAWSRAATLKVNGRAEPLAPVQGFAPVTRVWRTGDAVELRLPMPLRLEPLPADSAAGPAPLVAANAATVALMRGPLVLFAVRQATDAGPLTASETALLAAKQTGPREWTVLTAAGERRFVPFTELAERGYSTYVRLV